MTGDCMAEVLSILDACVPRTRVPRVLTFPTHERYQSTLDRVLSARLAEALADKLALHGNLADQSDRKLAEAGALLDCWPFVPNGSEGYAKAEVTLGGISTDGLSQQTMEAKKMPGLFCIGEAVDVTGWLGGYNFQWAWASGVAAGEAV